MNLCFQQALSPVLKYYPANLFPVALSTDGVFPGGCSTATAGDADLAVADCINVLSAAAQCK